MAIEKGFRRLRRIGLLEWGIRVRNIHEEHVDLLPNVADHGDRLAEIHLGVSRRMRQRYERLLGSQLRAAEDYKTMQRCICPAMGINAWRSAAKPEDKPKPLLFLESLEGAELPTDCGRAGSSGGSRAPP